MVATGRLDFFGGGMRNGYGRRCRDADYYDSRVRIVSPVQASYQAADAVAEHGADGETDGVADGPPGNADSASDGSPEGAEVLPDVMPNGAAEGVVSVVNGAGDGVVRIPEGEVGVAEAGFGVAQGDVNIAQGGGQFQLEVAVDFVADLNEGGTVGAQEVNHVRGVVLVGVDFLQVFAARLFLLAF